MLTTKTIFKDYNGEITGIITADTEAIEFWLIDHPDNGVVSGVFCGETYFIQPTGRLPVLRPTNPATINKTTFTANGVDSTTISNLPNPSVVRVDGVAYNVTDGEFEFTVDLTGKYQIIIDSFPYLPKGWEVTAI